MTPLRYVRWAAGLATVLTAVSCSQELPTPRSRSLAELRVVSGLVTDTEETEAARQRPSFKIFIANEDRPFRVGGPWPAEWFRPGRRRAIEPGDELVLWADEEREVWQIRAGDRVIAPFADKRWAVDRTFWATVGLCAAGVWFLTLLASWDPSDAGVAARRSSRQREAERGG